MDEDPRVQKDNDFAGGQAGSPDREQSMDSSCPAPKERLFPEHRKSALWFPGPI